MSFEIALVLFIFALSAILLVSEWLPLEVTALLVLGSVAMTGLVTPAEALTGFSSPAVVTVWAVFILSGGLTRTGVGSVISRYVLRAAGRHEAWLLVVIMATTGLLSAVMNNVAVAALMLPVVMDVARKTGQPPSRLLLPLAYGSLLGGLTTLIGTPPNILASASLRAAGKTPFGFFDYTPTGIAIMAAGIFFMVLVGRHLLPLRSVAGETTRSAADLPKEYELADRMVLMRLPPGNALAGKSLAESRIGSALGLNVVEILRDGGNLLAPAPTRSLQAGDRLLLEGRLERMERLRDWGNLIIREATPTPDVLLQAAFAIAEATLSTGSTLSGKTLEEADLRRRHNLNVLAIRRNGRITWSTLAARELAPGDTLLLHGLGEHLMEVGGDADFTGVQLAEAGQLEADYGLSAHLLALEVPGESPLAGQSLGEIRLGDALDMRVLLIRRQDGAIQMPSPEQTLAPGDRLIVQGRLADFELLQALEELELIREVRPDPATLESAGTGLMEAVLAPRTTLVGKSLRQINFREKYGLSVLAVWRKGRAHRSELGNFNLHLGDALLLYGPREKLRVLARDPDFLVLTQAVQEFPRQEKMGLSALIMAIAIVPVLMGWMPIYITAVIGAALMVATRCLTMEEAYRVIEWKAVFLIAGMLPLGLALERTGAARFLAEALLVLAQPYGPRVILCALLTITFVATCFIPTAALVVLMAPIVLSTAAQTGLSPHALMMAVALAASSSFMTPISHPANVLVMGPGGYRFRDYLKIGGPLTAVVFAVLIFVLPLFWPLQQRP